MPYLGVDTDKLPVTMSNSPTGNILADPVCGAAVGAGTKFHTVIGGTQRYFCSLVCRDRYCADPMQYEPAAESGAEDDAIATQRTVPAAPAMPEALEGPPSTFGLGEGHGPAPTHADEALHGSTQAPVVAASPAQAPGFFARLLPGKQRRFARRVSREMQALHGSVAQAHPDLRGLDLYRRIVMERLGTNHEGAEALLRKTDENFAWWPTTREITYIDVVHMIAMEEYHALYPKSAWMRNDMARIVAEEIDHAL